MTQSEGPKTATILIVDDEPLARLRIANYLKAKHPDLAVVEARDCIEALEFIHKSQPTVAFLDIEMPGMTGIEMLDQLVNRAFPVIFQTAFNDFAVKAFEQNACDYLLKPFTDERLERALIKALSQRGVADPAIERLLMQLPEPRKYLERIAIRAGAKMRLIEMDEIIYFLSDNHATRVFLSGVDFVYDQSLTFLEARIDPDVFQRIHRNAIVKLSTISSFKAGEVVLKNGTQLSVSRERSKELRDILTTTKD